MDHIPSNREPGKNNNNKTTTSLLPFFGQAFEHSKKITNTAKKDTNTWKLFQLSESVLPLLKIEGTVLVVA